MILWIGETTSPEFMSVHRVLAAGFDLQTVSSLAAASDWLSQTEGEPALLLFAQRWPGQFLADEVERLRRRAPLARCLALLGSWCEGEPRSGKPLPGVTRLYWHQWSERMTRELQRLVAGEAGEWSLPATATDEERLSLLVAGAEEAALRPQTPVAIWAHDRQAALAIADGLTAASIASVWRRPGNPQAVSRVAASVVDLSRGQENQWRMLADACTVQDSGPVVALLGFPRPEDARRAEGLGAAALLSKPLRTADLLAALQPAISAQGGAAT
jgi:CheY-like chemotaxis protein